MLLVGMACLHYDMIWASSLASSNMVWASFLYQVVLTKALTFYLLYQDNHLVRIVIWSESAS